MLAIVGPARGRRGVRSGSDRQVTVGAGQRGSCAGRGTNPAHVCGRLYVRAVLVQQDDLTAKARIRDAALELFAEA
ncbi:hypothetical protein B7486_61795, partial [cyanobacterium TDX16]